MNRKVIIAICLVALLAASQMALLVKPALNQGLTWVVYQNGATPDFVILYRTGQDADAQNVLEYCQQCKAWVDPLYPYTYSVLPGVPYDDSSSGDHRGGVTQNFPGKVLVYLYDLQTWHAMGKDQSQCYSDPDKGIMYFLTPSAVPSGDTWIDANWYQKNVVHEYVHIPTYRDLETTSYYSSAPFWLTEGIAEYISVFHTTTDIQKKYQWYTDTAKDAVTNDRGVFFYQEGYYLWAAYIMKYVFETYGSTLVDSLYKVNGVSNTWDAVKRVLHVRPLQFEYNWYHWVYSQFGLQSPRDYLGDTNFDGSVNLQDLVNLALNYGTTQPDP